MTAYGYRGQVVHHNNCTWCVHRYELPVAGKKKHHVERCQLTGRDIPPPFHGHDIGQRFCENYRQKGCECDNCQAVLVTTSGIFTNQMVDK